MSLGSSAEDILASFAEREAFLAHTYAFEVNTDVAPVCEIRKRSRGQLRAVINGCSVRGAQTPNHAFV
jgi:hypothetical protein